MMFIREHVRMINGQLRRQLPGADIWDAYYEHEEAEFRRALRYGASDREMVLRVSVIKRALESLKPNEIVDYVVQEWQAEIDALAAVLDGVRTPQEPTT